MAPTPRKPRPFLFYAACAYLLPDEGRSETHKPKLVQTFLSAQDQFQAEEKFMLWVRKKEPDHVLGPMKVQQMAVPLMESIAGWVINRRRAERETARSVSGSSSTPSHPPTEH